MRLSASHASSLTLKVPSSSTDRSWRGLASWSLSCACSLSMAVEKVCKGGREGGRGKEGEGERRGEGEGRAPLTELPTRRTEGSSVARILQTTTIRCQRGHSTADPRKGVTRPRRLGLGLGPVRLCNSPLFPVFVTKYNACDGSHSQLLLFSFAEESSSTSRRPLFSRMWSASSPSMGGPPGTVP